MSSRTILVLAALAAVLVLDMPAAKAQVEQVTLRVDGLACPFCAYGLEKKLKKLKGYRSLEVFLNQGTVIVGWQADEPVDMQALQAAVKKAGFTLRSVRGTLVGVVEKEDSRYLLVLPTTLDQRFYLYEPELFEPTAGAHQQDEGRADALSAELRKRLDDLAAGRKTVQIVGPIHSHSGAEIPSGLGVEHVADLSRPSEANDD
jgi:copper chaperone CopZ